jgi:hypothetical protein
MICGRDELLLNRAPAMKWPNRTARLSGLGELETTSVLKASSTRCPGAIRRMRNTITLQYSITPLARIRGRERKRSASRGRVIPGLKAWDVLLCHFMAMATSSVNRREP